MKLILRALAGLALCAGLFMTPTVWASGGDTCSSGAIAAGSYRSLTVTGFCSIADSGTVTVRGGLTISGPGAYLNAVTHGTINVSGGVRVVDGGSLLLGCSPEVGCDVTTVDHISGGLQASGAHALIVHNAVISGGLRVRGGGGGVTCDDVDPALTQIAGFPSPIFATFEDNTVSGGASVSGYGSCWFGFIRNHVSGAVSLTNNSFADPDAMEVVDNSIRGSLACSSNSPAAQVGDSEGGPNHVTGPMSGECASL